MRYVINKTNPTLGQKITLKISEVKNTDQISLKASAGQDDTAIIEISPKGPGRYEITPYALGPVEIQIYENGFPLKTKVTFNVLEKYPDQKEFLPSFGPFTRYGDIVFLLIVILLAILLWKIFKDRKKLVQAGAPVKTKTDYLQEWDQILKIENLEIKINKASLWLKNFMTEYLKEPSNHLTTPEMKSHQSFLKFCDEIKFSNQNHEDASQQFQKLSREISGWLNEVAK